MDMTEQTVIEEPQDAFFSRKAIAGVPWMVISKAILFFVYFAISVLLVRLLGDVQYGIYTICVNIAESAGILCSLGLVAALFRFVPELVVQENLAGLKRLIWKSFALQGAAVALVTLLFIAAKPLFERWFGIDFHYYLPLVGLMIAAGLLKDNVSAVETSLFRVKNISIMSLFRGLSMAAMIAVGLTLVPTVAMAISIQIAVGLIYVVGAILMFRHIYSFDWRSPLYGIGKRRTMKFSGAIMSSTILRMMTMKYTEVFFLGLVVAPEIVGAYDLGYSLPPMVIFFIPDALHMLFTSGFAEAYSRDKNCLPRLIKAYFKMQIAFTVPLAVFGFFFAAAAVRLIYGEQMALAGGIASAFCLIHLLSTISTPLSMALKAKEQVMASMPIMIFQIAINLALDWLLIVHLKMGTTGAMLALTSALVITMPVRITIIRRLLGGIYFPIGYLLRMAVSLFALAGAFAWVSNHWKLLELFSTEWMNLITLFVLGGLYMLCYLVLIRFLRLIREEDIADFRALDIKLLNKIFDILSPRAR
jgi:O-antigen/teichoic acid export membrane protein